MLSKTVVALSLFPLALSTPISLLSRQDANDTNISDADAVSIEAAANATATDPSVLAAESAGKGGACSDMIVVFARGTTEPAPIGTLTGPPFVKAIQKAIGSSTMNVQGVDYPADIAGFLAGGDKGGSSNMAQMITTAVTNCPNSAVVMSGYSQGGQLVHNAANELPASTMAKVSSVVIFGDPDNGEPVTGASAAKTKVICHAGDNICDHGDLILTPHLTYSVNADEAAAFVAANAGINSKD